MTNQCVHDFIKVRVNHVPPTHAVVVCAYCGQVRHVYADGKIDIIKQDGETSDTHHS